MVRLFCESLHVFLAFKQEKKKRKKKRKKEKKREKNNTEMGMLGAEGGGREEGGNTDWLTADTDSHRVLNVGLTVSLFRV